MSRGPRRNGLTQVEMSAENNLAYLCMTHDLPGAEEHCEVAVALPRRLGARSLEAVAAANLMYVLTFEGRFDEAYRLANDLLEAGADETRESGQLRIRLALLDAFRGEIGSAREQLTQCADYSESDNVEDRCIYATGESGVALAEGDFRAALRGGASGDRRGTRGSARDCQRVRSPCFSRCHRRGAVDRGSRRSRATRGHHREPAAR